ncbi:hypothetical protein N3K66_001362 [Trichothecium roseum]|uniref:Uncharacterized protein n=1 Tax=Trichothecium roseum TaxID=47278 RepID=A0ACC0VGE5_9HYPO|nr:hypothetical protein N3K66_001362 [Trichothecium roseum]
MQPIKIYNAPPGTGPNPWKAVIVLAELEIPYDSVWIPYSEIKQEPYVGINPNGRLPSMIDPNTNVTLFESGAIVQYIVNRYDKNNLISYGEDHLQERWATDSWLMFQMSGQGPMFGQKMWFTHFHADRNLTSAIERYGNETKRILGVIDSHLAKRRRELEAAPGTPVWLVGSKCTYADLSFVPWNILCLTRLFPEGGLDVEQDFPEFFQWHQSMVARPATDATIRQREHAMATMEDTAAAVLPKRGD